MVRIASSAVMLPVALFVVYKRGWYGAALYGFGAGAVASEYYLITLKKLSPAAWVGIAGTALMPFFPVWRDAWKIASIHAGDICLWWVGGFFFFAWAYHLIRGPLAEAPQIVSHLITGMLYGGLGMTALSELQSFPGNWVVVSMVITWANDTFAYFTGRLLGKHKLYPEVSPNKTWEGFFGGMAGSVGGLFVYRGLFETPLTAVDCVVVGLAGAVCGPIGDLCESMLKRAYGVKDSGKLIPGHGGVLDRIDALLFNSPMVFLYVYYLRALINPGIG